MSLQQKENLRSIIKNNKKARIIGLSGTLSNKTELELRNELNLPVISSYFLEEAIRDNIISDYKIYVIMTDLDNKKIVYPKKKRTEKQQFDSYTSVIKYRGPSLQLNLARMRVIHNSISKINKTKFILNKLKDKRVLVFCSGNDVAKELGCSIHTAKFNNQEEFDDFIENKSKNKHTAVCKIGNTGISFKSLYYIVVQAFDSNSENLTQRICRSLILDEKDKISSIYIICSTEKVELG